LDSEPEGKRLLGIFTWLLKENEFLATDPEVPGSILGATRFSEKWWVLFGSKRNGMTGRWRKLYNEELHNLYSSPSIIRIIKSRRMR
jgi:hypothetical protein